MNNILFKTFLLLIFLGFQPPLAQAQTLQEIAKYKAWRVFMTGTGVAVTCHIVSEPVSKKPKNVKRGEIFFAISHRPGQGVFNEVSLRIGYPFSKKSNPYAKVGADSFNFFSGAKMSVASASWAWMVNPANHALLIKAMQRGNRLTFKGTSKRGTLTTDEYSLIGFTAAYKRLNETCTQ